MNIKYDRFCSLGMIDKRSFEKKKKKHSDAGEL